MLNAFDPVVNGECVLSWIRKEGWDLLLVELNDAAGDRGAATTGATYCWAPSPAPPGMANSIDAEEVLDPDEELLSVLMGVHDAV